MGRHAAEREVKISTTMATSDDCSIIIKFVKYVGVCPYISTQRENNDVIEDIGLR